MTNIHFIHIGYHKTGTTWLQNYCLNLHPEIELLNHGQSNREMKRTIDELVDSVASSNDLNFDATAWRNSFDAAVSKLLGSKNNPSVLGISRENLSGEMLKGSNSALVANRLFKLFGKVKVIIVLRNQLDMIESIYKQYIQEGGTLSIEQFLDWKRYKIADVEERLKYHKLLAYYRDLFGEENVFVGLYEEFKESKKNFLVT